MPPDAGARWPSAIGYFIPVLTARLVGGFRDGQYLVEIGRGLLRETRDGPGGRVSLPDHRGPGND